MLSSPPKDLIVGVLKTIKSTQIYDWSFTMFTNNVQNKTVLDLQPDIPLGNLHEFL
ncbi:hypothetical protein DsansV1_C32g0221151 [Dioscorea sansibarensis]